MERFERRANASRSIRISPELTAAEREIWPTIDGHPSVDITLLDERRVAVVGDWESQSRLVAPLLQRIRREAPDVRTLLHVGDLRWSAPRTSAARGRNAPSEEFAAWLDEQLQRLQFQRLILVPGNNEWWDRLHEEFEDHPDRFFRAAHRIWIAPRGLRFELAGRTYLCMGGAASLHDDGGPFEAPTDADIEHAAAGGEVDILLTHEALNVDMPELTSAMRRGPRFSDTRMAASAESRNRVTQLYNRVRPQLAFFGHMHSSGSAATDFGIVHCLNVIRRPRHVALLNVHTLEVQWLEDLPEAHQINRLDA